jgi:hypothetical protein
MFPSIETKMEQVMQTHTSPQELSTSQIKDVLARSEIEGGDMVTDLVSLFIKDCLKIDEGAHIGTMSLWIAFQGWVTSHGVFCIERQTLIAAMRENGFRLAPIHGHDVWAGVRLNDVAKWRFQ